MPASFYYILSGENEDISESELKTLLEIYDENSTYSCRPMICLVSHVKDDAWAKVARRAANIREVGVVLHHRVVSGWSEVEDFIEEIQSRSEGFEWIHVTQLKNLWGEAEFYRLVETLEKKTGLKTEFKKGPSLRVIVSGNTIISGKTLFKPRSKTGYLKVFDRSIAITPRLARTLINLSAIREGGVLLDPFVGTGTIILEARSMGFIGIGVDIDWSIIQGFNRNLVYNRIPSIPVLSDSSKASFLNVDSVVTDPPYGRGASTRGLDVKGLVEAFLNNALDSVNKGGRIVFMTPVEVEEDVDDIVARSGGYVKSKHYMYVHSSLGRVIYVVAPV
jgi:tRNA (guanine10-N2)-dimethyltransferase